MLDQLDRSRLAEARTRHAGYLFATLDGTRSADSRAWLATMRSQVSSAAIRKTAAGDRLNIALFAAGKAGIVFGGTLALSWAAAVAFGNVSWDNHLAQAKRLMPASISEPAPVKLAKQDDLPG